jgi:hypothetical protein
VNRKEKKEEKRQKRNQKKNKEERKTETTPPQARSWWFPHASSLPTPLDPRDQCAE